MEYNYKLRGKNVPSSKNNKRIVHFNIGKQRVARLINSELAMEYYNWVLDKLEKMKPEILADLETKQAPYKFHFFYYRSSNRHWDYINMCQIIADALQKAEILVEDDATHFIPVFDGFAVDKENPGVEFYIE